MWGLLSIWVGLKNNILMCLELIKILVWLSVLLHNIQDTNFSGIRSGYFLKTVLLSP